jgi:L-alanine-DL-glutamate epimerase-like enolase superfamily enzyme
MASIRRAEVIVVDPGTSLRWTERAKSCAVGTTILRLVDSDGVEGIAGSDSSTFGSADRSTLEAVRSMWPWLEGRSIDCREALAKDMRVGVVFPFSTAPLALVDVALWDLAAKHAGLPLWKLLGGAQEQLPAYASLETMPAEADYVDVVGRAQADGIRAVKLHAFGEPDRDIALFGLLRETYPDLTFMHDAESVYDHREALKVGRALDELDCRWYEAPLPDFDLEGYRDLRRCLNVPVLPAGYAMWDVRQLADALRDPPWDACRSEIIATLGITALCKMMGLARAFDMALEPVTYGHSLLATAGLHMAQAFANVSYFELAYPVEPWEYGVVNPVRPNADGMVRAPDGDGLGVVMDWDAIEAMTSHRISLGPEFAHV